MNPLGKLCNYCKRSSERTKQCKCVHIRYCSIDCQTNDWKKHKKVCKIMTQRKGHQSFENKVVKALTTERGPLLDKYLKKLGGIYVEFKYLGVDLDGPTIENISLIIAVSILYNLRLSVLEYQDERLYLGECPGVFSKIEPSSIDVDKVFPCRNDKSLCILFVYYDHMGLNMFNERTKAIQLQVE